MTMAAVSVPLVTQQQPRGLIRGVPLPSWLEQLTQRDHLVYRVHAALGTALDWHGLRPAASASEWFKATYHARSNEELEAATRGLLLAETHLSPASLEASLCPFVSDWSGVGWGARGRELDAMLQAGLTCGDQSTVFGTVPDDVPIDYPMNPPTAGLYHETFYPGYGLTAEPIAPAMWVHNLAHGEIVLLYRCPDDCAEVEQMVRELQPSLPPGRNSRGRGARLVASRYDDMGYSFAVLAWGRALPLQSFDREQITEFYLNEADQGVECRNLYCSD
ncbi:MAG: DUF3105 domain-containing protein [Chloroflexi bacterium]|nr:DUF3105 domain-containing protein [Chloroflexota bacterium]